jgi:hypothetical protein
LQSLLYPESNISLLFMHYPLFLSLSLFLLLDCLFYCQDTCCSKVLLCLMLSGLLLFLDEALIHELKGMELSYNLIDLRSRSIFISKACK